jgi:hypothetical protein
MADARYAHLTPAQWGMLVLVLASFSVLTTSFFAKKPVV